jgi:hypothetical protein
MDYLYYSRVSHINYYNQGIRYTLRPVDPFLLRDGWKDRLAKQSLVAVEWPQADGCDLLQSRRIVQNDYKPSHMLWTICAMQKIDDLLAFDTQRMVLYQEALANADFKPMFQFLQDHNML